MKRLGFRYHQHCTFHLLQRIIDKIKKEVNKLVNQYKNEIKEENPKISKNKLKKLLNDKNKELWKEYQIYIDEIKFIFKQDTRNAAVEKINEIKRKIRDYPNFIGYYLKNNFFPNYAQYLVFLEKIVKKNTWKILIIKLKITLAILWINQKREYSEQLKDCLAIFFIGKMVGSPID